MRLVKLIKYKEDCKNHLEYTPSLIINDCWRIKIDKQLSTIKGIWNAHDSCLKNNAKNKLKSVGKECTEVEKYKRVLYLDISSSYTAVKQW